VPYRSHVVASPSRDFGGRREGETSTQDGSIQITISGEIDDSAVAARNGQHV
jgi:hypothetical protein